MSVSGTSAQQIAATSSGTARQPAFATSSPKVGKKRSCPRRVARCEDAHDGTAVRFKPTVDDCRARNEADAARSEPREQSPQQKELPRLPNEYRGAGGNREQGATPTAIVRRNPNRSKMPAANGPISPNSPMFTAMASEIVAVLQPNSRSNGAISIVGDERTAADAINSTKASAATTYA